MQHLRPSATWAEGLSDKERVFVEEYLIDLNGRQACIRCGYAESSASNDARKMLDKSSVAGAIDKALAERPGISRTRIVDELAKIAFANMGDYATWNADGVTLVDSEALEVAQRAAVLEVKETRTETDRSSSTTVNFKLHDKVGALEKLGKVFRMFVDRTELSGPEGGPIQHEEIRARIRARLERLRERTELSAEIAAPPALPLLAAPSAVTADPLVVPDASA